MFARYSVVLVDRWVHVMVREVSTLCRCAHGTIHGPHDMRVGLLEHRAGLGDLHNEAAMNRSQAVFVITLERVRVLRRLRPVFVEVFITSPSMLGEAAFVKSFLAL